MLFRSSLSFFGIPYKNTSIRPGSKFVHFQMFDISQKPPNPRVREPWLTSRSHLIWSFTYRFTRNPIKYITNRLECISQKRYRQTRKAHMDRIISNRIQFLLSDTPLCCGVLGWVHCERIPFSSRYVKNSLKKYSSPQSN